jgi:hypothetical protein
MATKNAEATKLRLFIEYNSTRGENHPLLLDLTNKYLATEQALALAEQRLSELKDRRGERILRHDLEQCKWRDVPDRSNPLSLERERAYEVSQLRLELANEDLFHALHELFAVAGTIKSGLIKPVHRFAPVEEGIAQNNAVCAFDLVNQAFTRYQYVKQTQLRESRWIYSAIHDTFRKLDEPQADPREFVVMASGHGSSFRFDGPDPDQPPPGPYLTRAEADREAAHWESIADTIGGRAAIYNVRTKQIVG